MRKKSYFLVSWSIGVFIFLYVPILYMIAFSFNGGRLVSVWGGFSFRWYVEIFNDTAFLSAAWLSLKIATISASLALVIGTAAALAISRYGKFTGRMLLTGMVLSPLILPDVILGLSLLLLFVSLENLIGWPPERGFVTIVIAHTTFCVAYVTGVMQSQLLFLNPSIEEAAMDLGARPARVFWDIVLPSVTPALLSAWLLSFTLSLDDVVIASFVTGPNATTLPIFIFSKIRFGLSPMINVLATFIVIFVSILVIAISYYTFRNEKKKLLSESGS
ncbi:MAG: ABC transporter permease subunit [Methylacidiphilales bacterium]|nr:ABC transporter permease subunit [Candidatus Methylacidiphilales bacterium]